MTVQTASSLGTEEWLFVLRVNGELAMWGEPSLRGMHGLRHHGLLQLTKLKPLVPSSSKVSSAPKSKFRNSKAWGWGGEERCVAKKLGKLEEKRDWLDLQGSAALWPLWPAGRHTQLLCWSVEARSQDFYLEIPVIGV